MFPPQSVALNFFSYQEITDFRYFRNMISLLISQLFFHVILFNMKILNVLDSCFRSFFFNHLGPLLYCGVFELTALSHLRNYRMFISGFHHQIMSGSLLLKQL